MMAALREQFAHDRDLNQFMVQAIPTGRHLGAGSYGAVEEVVKIQLQRYRCEMAITVHEFCYHAG